MRVVVDEGWDGEGEGRGGGKISIASKETSLCKEEKVIGKFVRRDADGMIYVE